MHSGVSSVNNGSYLAHVGLPHSVGFTIGVRNVLSEDNALSANITFCHLKTPPVSAIRNIYFLLFSATFQDASSIIPQRFKKIKGFLKKSAINLIHFSEINLKSGKLLIGFDDENCEFAFFQFFGQNEVRKSGLSNHLFE